ncbi:hypothetical protein CEXT_259181 [Caerostris extrusa]|uniref:Uncharacterized protein n=1 Tax=Caerostris extrusa TaxID=172846 RepID=A0AAV4PA10_CAEEX|nr:hypothetical protein CEXT_259181 [Caerostris extrusa]
MYELTCTELRLAKQKAEIIGYEAFNQVHSILPIQNNCLQSAPVNKAIRQTDALGMISAINEHPIGSDRMHCLR